MFSLLSKPRGSAFLQCAFQAGMRGAGFLNNALVRAAPGELQAGALEAMLEVAAAAPAAFAGGYRAKVPWLQGFLGHVNPAGEPRRCAMPEASLKQLDFSFHICSAIHRRCSCMSFAKDPLVY